MIGLEQFENFYLVAQLQSITEAARRIGVSKTAVSLQIKKLEQSIGVDLFIRINQRLQLTENGLLLFQQCRRLQKEIDETRSVCKQFLTYPEGVLRITVFEYFANKLIFPKITEFCNLYPKIQLVVNVSEEIPDFSSGNVDVAIGFASQPPSDDLIQRVLCKANYVLCASPAYFNQYGLPQRLDELSYHRYICHENRIVSNQIIKLKDDYQLNIKPYLVLNKVSSVIECALNGLGIIQVPQYVAQQFLDIGSLVEIFPEQQAIDKDIYYYYSKFRYVEPKIRKFIDYFLLPLV